MSNVTYNALVKCVVKCGVVDVSQLVIQQKTKLIIEELSLQNGEHPTHIFSYQDHRPATSDITDAVVESVDSCTYVGTNILIFPWNENMDLHSGTYALACNNEKWTASLELNRND
ncbi:hypothetical protein H5410_033220 [Solanum commersonii]|uniref:Uncharacterized protein n=1 Tax=Solanum commersonii TaxID=4109 RepID=A0A9J5YN20_SOLCO|nr:hypothetical protein H5410_033220 [Solanum commersonii]